ncbi:MAG TPA: DeoR family transcriptional regulator, partial [Anaerolineae bacterium]|nr:DeoR family transcriptional regulator [Anaerolineae bacterium]
MQQGPSADNEIHALLQAGPSEKLACYSERTSERKLAETMVAMANAEGGTILLGVSSRGDRITGLLDPDAARDRALSASLMPEPPLILPVPHITWLNEKAVCIITIPPGLPHVYSIKGAYLTRTGRHNRPLTTPELRRLLLDREEASFESLPVEGATLADLDQELIARYLTQLEGLADEDASEILTSRGCLVATEQELHPTHAGILLFGRDPQRFLHSAEIILIRYGGLTMEDEFLRQDVRGTLPEQIRQAEVFLVANMRKGMRIQGLEREERPEYPVPVVREAIVNAVAHRDYSIRGDCIRVLMFSDRLEVYSPGRLPGHVTVENIVDERYSRNEVIVQILSDMGFIERLGYGIDRMIRAMEEEGLPRPQFEETAAGFRVTLRGHGSTLISPRPETQRWGNLLLNPRQEKALAYVAEHGRITNREYQNLAPDVSSETIRRDLADLVDQGLLLKIGEKRAT